MTRVCQEPELGEEVLPLGDVGKANKTAVEIKQGQKQEHVDWEKKDS